MPTDQPSNAPDAIEPREDASVASVLADGSLDQPPGGGGMGGASAGGQGAPSAGTVPNAPIDVPIPAGATDAGMAPSADAQARHEATANPAPEPHPASQ